MSNLTPSVLYDDFEPDMFQPIQETIKENEFVEPEVKTPPVDKHGFVNLIFYFLGVTILLPWAFFVTCNDYWMYRFRDVQNHTINDGFELRNLTSHQFKLVNTFPLFVSTDQTNRTSLQVDFTAYLSLAATVPNTFVLFLNMFHLRKFSIHWRIMISNAIVLFLFIFTTILVLFDSDSWQYLFFIITLITVVILNVASAVLQAALCAVFMKFPTSYISSSTLGLSLSGVFAAIAQILVLLANTSIKESTFVYFIFADATILVAFIGYIFMRKTEFYKFYADNESTNDDETSVPYRRLIGNVVNSELVPVSYVTVSKKIWILNTSMFFCYVVTCSVYPSLAVLVRSKNEKQYKWSDSYFVPVVTYLLYYIFEYGGRVVAGVIRRPNGLSLAWLSVMRVVFVPLLMLCNAQPRHHLPVLINSDWIYAVILIVLATSNGYITTLTLILVPKIVPQAHEQEVASTMLIIWLALGLLVGSSLSFPIINAL